MAGIGPAKIAAVKGAQPVDWDAVGELVKNADKLQISGQSAGSDVPGLMTSPGTVIPGNAFDAYRLPARVDPEQIIAAQRELARATALQQAAGTLIPTVGSVRRGIAPGSVPGGPMWDAVREQISEPLMRAQLNADQINQYNDLANKIVGLNAGARGQDRSLAMQLTMAQGTARVAALDRATQQKQFEESQATARRGQDMTLRGMQARLNGPQAEKVHQARALIASTLSGLDDLQQKIQTGGGSMLHGSILGQRIGGEAGADTANTIGMLANNISQIAEKRAMRGPAQDEIVSELNSGLATPQAGLKAIAKWRKYAKDYEDEIGHGMSLGLDTGAGENGSGGGAWNPTQPIEGE